MITRRMVMAVGISAVAVAGPPRLASATTFHGFDPTKVGADRPSTDDLKAMVAEAMKRTPPRNGQRYVFGYTMWGGSSPFSQLNRQGLQELSDAAGIDLLVADNEWEPQRNVANVEAFALRQVDFVINSLLDIQFASAVRRPLDDAHIPLLALDIPVPGSKWVGVNNALAGFTAGTYRVVQRRATLGLAARCSGGGPFQHGAGRGNGRGKARRCQHRSGVHRHGLVFPQELRPGRHPDRARGSGWGGRSA